MSFQSFSLLIAGVISVLSLPATAQNEEYPGKVQAQYDKVYVPVGFDSNDHIQITGTGMYENACYRPAETSVEVDKEKKRITIGPVAYKYDGFCLQVVNRFERVIDVGVLPAGNYEIYQKSNSEVLGRLQVKEAKTEAADDFNYAPVSQALVDGSGANAELILKGEFPTDCMKIDDVKISTENEVIVVQPTVKVDRREDCAMGYFPFRKAIKTKVPKGRYLLHVRSMNANAVNNVIQID